MDSKTVQLEFGNCFWFLYPIYPLICIAASAVIKSFPDLFRDKYDSFDTSIIVKVAKFLRLVVLSIILYSSHARTFSLIHGYSAPIEIYKLLEHHDDVANVFKITCSMKVFASYFGPSGSSL
ncbi:dol-P-Man:Man(6)GlcNAc(2)-PP-Dol alpha-1,2-mannosyltransferase-like isoform X2 [Vicia villosa]|uniref:dol-P-Man:Man(6)GlcNAc(2)-PP-Dol alpha-1,2-mannosyltransferase-like isoform X2 n=1 Tax=Vicia villosa TaxID=3911 RepID=UPI00273BA94B|nr:dol-P-Man:Man(6)GlcNAc(2)-PP-Dol alpha-1,2-mannosyltransferase-like isoform X2 [Vicia villosa]